MAKPNFTLVTDFQSLIRREFEVLASASSTLTQAEWQAGNISLDPDANYPLLDGEFLSINNKYQLTRPLEGAPAEDADGSDAATSPAFACFVERGRYDTRAIGKVTVLFGGSYEADTTVWGVDAPTVGEKLYVTTISAANADANEGNPSKGGTYRGLMNASAGGLVHGYCTREPASNGGKLRFVCVAP